MTGKRWYWRVRYLRLTGRYTEVVEQWCFQTKMEAVDFLIAQCGKVPAIPGSTMYDKVRRVAL